MDCRVSLSKRYSLSSLDDIKKIENETGVYLYLFSITSPAFFSYSSSFTSPFTNHRTIGSGLPGTSKLTVKNRERERFTFERNPSLFY